MPDINWQDAMGLSGPVFNQLLIQAGLDPAQFATTVPLGDHPNSNRTSTILNMPGYQSYWDDSGGMIHEGLRSPTGQTTEMSFEQGPSGWGDFWKDVAIGGGLLMGGIGLAEGFGGSLGAAELGTGELGASGMGMGEGLGAGMGFGTGGTTGTATTAGAGLTGEGVTGLTGMGMLTGGVPEAAALSPGLSYGMATPLTASAAGGGSGGGLFDSLSGIFSGSGGLGNIAQLASSVYGIYSGNKMLDLSKNADPFGAYRGQFAQQLSDLMKNPSSVTNMPGYKANMAASEQALTRNLASQGLTGSGTAAEALTKFGAEYQGNYFNQLLSQLMTLSGAGSMGAGMQGQMMAGGYNTIGQSLNNLVKMFPKGG